MVHVDCLPNETTKNVEYYINLRKQVRQSINEKRHVKIRRGILLHQDYISRAALGTVHECGYELLLQQPYSQILPPDDFHLHGQINRSRRFIIKDDYILTSTVEGWLEGRDVELNCSGINDWQTRWNNCSESEGYYVKNLAVFCVSLIFFFFFFLISPRTCILYQLYDQKR